MNKVTLAGARVSAGLKQGEMADILGISRATLSRWETGKEGIRPIHLYAICHITGFSESDILLPSNITKSNI